MNSFPYPSFPPAQLAANGAPKRVIVVGAGLAGLVAAHALMNAGHDVIVLEASDRPGGRVCTLRSGFSDGLYADAGASFVPGAHSYTVGFALYFGLALVSYGKQGRSTDFLAGWRIDDQGRAKWPVPLSPSELASTPPDWLRQYVHSALDAILSEPPRASDWPPPSLHALDTVSFAQFLSNAGASPGAISVLRRGFFDLWGDGVDACSALLILRDMANTIVAASKDTPATAAPAHPATHMYRAAAPTPARALTPATANVAIPATATTAAATTAAATATPQYSTPTFVRAVAPPAITNIADVDPHGVYHIEGGNDALPYAFAKGLGARLRYGSPVTRIEQDATGVRVYCAGTAAPVTGDYVISAIPLSTFRLVDVAPALSAAKARAVAELPYTSVTRLFLQFDERFWLNEGLEGLASTDLPVSDNAPIPGFWIEDTTSVQAGTAGILDCYITGQRAREFAAMTDDARVAYTLDQVERVFPGAKSHYSGRAMTKIWDAEPWARGGYGYFRPGQMQTVYPLLATPEGRIHFAGEATSALPAWMQGALESGLRAAAEVNDA
jgi:monoamine oxidase